MDSIPVEQVWATLARMVECISEKAREEERIYTNGIG
jgi:hypothetical protein